jgi:hypothetical protein
MVPILTPLTPRGQQMMSLVLNAVAFGTLAEIGNLDSLINAIQTLHQSGHSNRKIAR